MYEQTSLFSNNNLHLVEEPSPSIPSEKLKCFKSELKEVKFLTLEDLFDGFNSIKAITFSYDIGFINRIMEHFNYGEIILGGNFLVQKDQKTMNLLAEVLTNAYESGQLVKKYEKLTHMLAEGDIQFKTSLYVLDHRKIYILKADDGRTRVIKASANMSKKAWNNEQLEHYEYDDTIECYEEYAKDFETAWSMSQEITMDVISSKKADDLIEGNAILMKVKETGQAIVLQQPEDDILIENIRYTIDHEAIKEEYKVILDGVNPKAKNGLIEIIPKTLEKIVHNQKKVAQRNLQIHNITEKYPSITYDLDENTAYLSGKKLNLCPTEQEIRHDIDELLNIFSNFNQFAACDPEKMKHTHYKLLNVIFASPFFAQIRCASFLQGIATNSIPMAALIVSSGANCGKTFMISVALKLMTGKNVTIFTTKEMNSDNLINAQKVVKGTPVFVDEYNGTYRSNIINILKNPDECERNQRENQPLLVFASNDVTEPDEILRKRMVFLRLSGALPSNVDQSAYKSKGNAIIRRLGNGLYREYFRRMMPKVKELLDYIIHEEKDDAYYPDIIAIASETFLSILDDYGYSIPSYMKKLTWNDDFSLNAKYIYEDAILDIGDLYKKDKKAFTIQKDTVIITLGVDKGSKRKIDSWKSVLPVELRADISTTSDYSRITLDRKELEARLGYKLKKFPLF